MSEASHKIEALSDLAALILRLDAMDATGNRELRYARSDALSARDHVAQIVENKYPTRKPRETKGTGVMSGNLAVPLTLDAPVRIGETARDQ